MTENTKLTTLAPTWAVATKAVVMPKTLAACSDLLYQTRNDRLALQKVVDELEKTESAIRENLIKSLPKSQATGVAGKVARATVETKDVYTISNWDKAYEYLVKAYPKDHGVFALLQRRVNDKTAADLLANAANARERKVVEGFISKLVIPVVRLNKV